MESMLAPAHILSYGTLLGSQVFETFVASVIAFKSLERPAFSKLQNHTFPCYFGMTTALPVVVALTFPGLKTAVSTVAPSLAGVLDESVRCGTLVPLATVFFTSLTNLVCFLPRAKEIKAQRAKLEATEGKSQYEAPHSPAMTKLNKSFARIHGFSTSFNLIGVAASIAYGITLARRLQ